MSIGIVSDQELEKELNKIQGTTIPSGKVIEKPSKGRSEGDVNVPDSLRQIIGETAVIDGRQSALELARDFGISPSSVSAYAKGATSTASYDTPVKSIISHINKSRHRAIKRAAHTLNSALGSITQEKLDYADAKDLAGIAKDMAVIIKNLEPPTSAPAEDKQPQFVIFAPQFRDERSFGNPIVVTE
jgi:hypothetical protein